MVPVKQQKGIMQLILEGNSNRDLVRSHGNLTMYQAMNGNYRAIGALVGDLGGKKVEKVLAVILTETSAYFDSEMGRDQALDIAAEITGKYNYLRIEDVWVCLNGLKSAEIYGKLTSNKILNAMRSYAETRIEAAGQQSLNQHLARSEARTQSSTEGKFKDFKHQWELEKLKKTVEDK